MKMKRRISDDEIRVLALLRERGEKRFEQLARHMRVVGFTDKRTKKLLDAMEAKGWLRKTVENVRDDFWGARAILRYRHNGHANKLMNMKNRDLLDHFTKAKVPDFLEVLSKYLRNEKVERVRAILQR